MLTGNRGEIVTVIGSKLSAKLPGSQGKKQITLLEEKKNSHQLSGKINSSLALPFAEIMLSFL